MVSFVFIAQSAEYLNRVFHGRLVNLHGGKSSLERGVLFHVFSVLFESGRAYRLQFAAGKHGF